MTRCDWNHHLFPGSGDQTEFRKKKEDIFKMKKQRNSQLNKHLHAQHDSRSPSGTLSLRLSSVFELCLTPGLTLCLCLSLDPPRGIMSAGAPVGYEWRLERKTLTVGDRKGHKTNEQFWSLRCSCREKATNELKFQSAEYLKCRYNVL